MKEEKPFYLHGKGENVISQEDIEKFIELNPSLEEAIKNHDIELKLLSYSHFESFCYWIISQQISGNVANKIITRFRKLFNGNVVPSKVERTPNEMLKKVGLSSQKTRYIKNVARFFIDSNHIKNHKKFSSKEILEHYTKIKGVGPWTVNMFLIFNLGRKDIFAPKDLVVRKGVKKLYSLEQIPSVKEVRKICKNWNSLATIGTILSWSIMGE